jgi:hypothetical protein
VLFKASSEGEFTEKFSIFLGPKSEEVNEAILPIVPLNLESRIFVMI